MDHAESRGWFEGILRRIPGFRGYLEKEYRRDSDALQREHLADTLQRAKKHLDEVTRLLLDSGQIDPLSQIERLRARIDQLIGRIRGAMPGYSGFFDLVQVDEALLERVYEHDYQLGAAVAQLSESLSTAASTGTSAEERANALADATTAIDAVAGAWDRREDILKGVA